MTPFKNVTSDKLLGVNLDHNLSWEKHFTTIMSIENLLSLEESNVRYSYLLESYFLIHTFYLTLTIVQLSGAVHHIHRT